MTAKPRKMTRDELIDDLRRLVESFERQSRYAKQHSDAINRECRELGQYKLGLAHGYAEAAAEVRLIVEEIDGIANN